MSAEYNEKTYTFEFRYRDPWQWLCGLVTDLELCKSIAWYPVHKYLHDNERVTRIYDEPHTADTWWDVQVSVRFYWFSDDY